ncbi:endonuclease/exonuclease/phosphatase family protein [Pseudodesulfovibrio sediminis]|uniref:Endonuclease n=1 Tax=Pseudodesulfovibrio sediminis TaxID=2810563 RepID=A0ABM7P5G9_9BACT|nr:endonuclease/exonuclease/phosphatase family protein [Pseudodesulfovibrio sediminis]BCS88167.1 endonuclease [Pseudodesulfovibrio sediminis]
MKFRCATFNLYQYVEPPSCWYDKDNFYTLADWESKNTWIKRQVVALGADVVGFQEVFSQESLKELMATIGYPYFATVDTPVMSDEITGIFVRPVVALASKHPIANVGPVEVASTIQHDLPVPDEFNFSRVPLRAEIEIADGLAVTVYVAHLKSKRPMVMEPTFGDDTSWQVKVRECMRATSRGQAASLLQRGAEASALYHEVTRVLGDTDNLPIVVMGDLNDDEESIPIEALSYKGRVYSIAGVPYGDLPMEAKRAAYSNKLYDAFFMAPNQEGGVRPPTHYHMGRGGTLDYIFMSNAFNLKNRNHVGRVVDFAVHGDHLNGDGVGDHKQSDHAQVLAEIEFK